MSTLNKISTNRSRLCFLADSGSVAVEVAIKMAMQYWQAQDEPRKEILALRNSYYGDTFGTMSVCDPDNSMHNIYHGYLPKNRFIDSSSRRFDEVWLEGNDAQLIDVLNIHHSKIAAIIMKPIDNVLVHALLSS